MAQSEVQQNLIPNDPELKDLLDLFKKDIFLSLNCHHIGTVESFDKTNQTCKATINYKKTFYEPNGQGVYRAVLKDYPVLVDCPVMFLGGGGYSLTFPVTQGDECLVLFNDRDIDNWFAGSSNSAVSTPRLHAYTDAIVIVGLRSLKNVIVDFEDEGIQLRNRTGTSSVTIYSDKITAQVGPALTPTVIEIDENGKLRIENPTGDFMAMIVQLFTDIQNGLVTTMLGEQPLKMPTFALDLAALETFKP